MKKNILLEKKTKIVATIGPATEQKGMLKGLIEAGLDVVRLNFSHGSHDEHQLRLTNARALSKELNKQVAVLQDLSGPKIRLGEFYKDRVILKEGDDFLLTTEKIVGDENKAYLSYAALPKEVKAGDFILLDDGKKKLQVVKTSATEIKTKIIIGGETKGRRGVNVPGVDLGISSLTEKDRKDLEFGLKNDVDFIALSFVRRPSDVKELRAILKKRKSKALIVAKIETQQAVDMIDDIIAVADAVMVARGDLAIEIGAEYVPMVQKSIIQKCNAYGKPVITATQMLESMINTAVPTRAEVSDVANAIIDGTDAVMLSEETTLGKFPREAIEVMSRIALEVENKCKRTNDFPGVQGSIIVDTVSGAVAFTADEIGAKLIVALTHRGTTPRMISRFKPKQPILAFTLDERASHQLALSYGVTPIRMKTVTRLGDAAKYVRDYLIKNKVLVKGESFVLTAGLPLGTAVQTNSLIVETL